MLERILRDLDHKSHEHAIDAIDRPYSGDVSFEAGRRQGVHQGLRLARQIIIDSLKDEKNDTAGENRATVRRLG